MAFHYVKWHIVHSIQWPQCQITLARVGLLSTTQWPQCQITLARVGLLSSIEKPQCQITMLALWLSWPFDNAGFLV